MKHLGDITKLKGNEIPVVDIITGGSPCQDLSVAGKRAGLAGERSGLFMEQIRIIKEMRENDKRNKGSDVNIRFLRPRFMVWENVPGAFSSNSGEDFRAVLEETAKIADETAVIPKLEGGQRWTPSGCILGDGWSIAWRVHDAQFWGVPQRRKRIALVADFGGASAPEILFERIGLSGNTEESREEGENTSQNAQRGIGETISFQERAGKAGGGKGILIQNERTGALSTLNNQSVVYGICSDGSNSMRSNNPHSGIYEADTSRTLDLNGGNPACNQGGMAVVQSAGFDGYNQSIDIEIAQPLRAADGGDSTPKVVCIEGNGSRPPHQGDGWHEGDPMYTLNSTEHHAVAYRKQGRPQNAEQGQGWEQTDANDTLNAFDSGEGRTPTLVVDQGAGKSQCSVSEELAPTLATTHGGEPVVLENHPADSRVKISEDGVVQTLSSRMGTGGGNVPMVMGTYQKTVGSLCASGYDKLGTQEAANDMYVVQGQLWNGSQVSPTLTANNAAGNQRMPDKENFNCVITYGLDRAAYNQGKNAKFGFSVDEELVGAQTAKGPGAVLQAINKDNNDEPVLFESNQNHATVRTDGVSTTLSASMGMGGGYVPMITNENEQEVKKAGEEVRTVVRRLTPLECERLQGYPDEWTDIGDWVDSKGKTHKGESDSPRYKALGNSIALPFWEWMAKRMVEQLKADGVENPTMASLFDGIGGFPLVYQRCGCEPVWASEIEEFPIAVTKIRFPDEGEKNE